MTIQKIGRYEIIRELGRGGMGTVFLARDPAFDRLVAVKILPAQLTHDPQFLLRFQREAKVIAALEHASIVPVYDYGEDAETGQPFIVMRFMSGGTLGERLTSGRMPLREVAPIAQRLADALDEAHSHNIVHRDLKPGNIIFDNKGQAFLSDFGIAKLLENNSLLTGTGIVGTPAYMSPEQAAGGSTIDGRSDVYSLGIIVYEMLSGHHPYGVETPMSMLYKQVNETPPPLDTAGLGLPAVSRRIVARALAKKPDERYPSAGEFAKYLSGLHTGPPILAPAKPSEPLAPPPPLSPTLPVGATPKNEKPEASPTPPTRTIQRLSPWRLGLLAVPIMGALMCVAVVIVLNINPFGNQPTLTPSPTLTSRPTLTIAPPSHTPKPTNTSQKPTATFAATSTVTDTPMPSPTNTPSATPTRAPTARKTSTRVPATNTSAPLLPSNTPAPPVNTSAPPQPTNPPQPTTVPTNTPVPEPPTNTPAP